MFGLQWSICFLAVAAFATAQVPSATLGPSCQDIESPPARSTENEMGLRTLRAEWTVGKKLSADAERNATIMVDPATTQYLNRIGQALIHNAGLKGCFTVKVIKDVTPNAYSLPGGFLYVTSRLILMADDESELAAALAHEIAHVNARHFTRINHRRRVGGQLALVGGPAGYLTRRLFGPLVTLKLQRNSEYDADRLGFSYLSASGYDPTAIVRLLQSAFEDDPQAPFFDRLFDTHPLTTTRVKRLNRMARRSAPRDADYVVDTDEFQNIRARVSLLTNIPISNDDDQPASGSE